MAADLSNFEKTTGLWRKFTPKIEDGIEVGVETEKTSEDIHQDCRTMNPITLY